MYLLDTNIWLERLLDQDQSLVVGEFLDTIPLNQLLLSDFSLHSIGVILGRLKQSDIFLQFVQDVLLDGGVGLVSLPATAMSQVTNIMTQHQLDFDDAYQCAAAELYNAAIISFDRDFDRTEQGRQTPAQILDAITPSTNSQREDDDS